MQYRLNVNVPTKAIYRSSLKLGGRSPAGDEISFTNYYMELNGQPYIGICGEFHYSRYPEEHWQAELGKMKASGITIVATYIFWNHHEAQEDEWSWEGNRNLKRFIKLCSQSGLYVILRIGPFCHGEVRNGGLPDWLFGRAFEVRSNDSGYMQYVGRLYDEIGRQSAGLMFKDGGPVIGIQLENEFEASAALWELTAKQGDEYISGGTGGAEHMRRLKELALEAGLEAPIYTSTGWGGAPVLEDEVLPLYGGYAYTPWSNNGTGKEQEPTREYQFESYHEDGAKGDFNPPYPKSKYPYACCEMGGGMQTWYGARFQVDTESAAAMSLVKLAGGCNFVGYYMFHGGTNPVTESGYLNESTTPKVTYDFQAPIGEFGQVRSSNHPLRLLHYFLQSFGAQLAPMSTVLPDGAGELEPGDTGTLRYAARTDGHSGFLFVNNYQDHVEMKEHCGVRFSMELGGETLQLPASGSLTIAPKASFILPLRMELSGLRLRHATAQPVTLLESENGGTCFFVMPEGIDGELVWEAEGIEAVEAEASRVDYDADGQCYRITVPHQQPGMITIRRTEGKPLRVYVMPYREACTMWLIEAGGHKRVLFSEVPVAVDGGGLVFHSFGQHEFTFREYTFREYTDEHGVDRTEDHSEGRAAPYVLEGSGSLSAERDGWFRTCRVTVPEQRIGMTVKPLRPLKTAVYLEDGIPDGLEDVLLRIDYTGNVGYAFTQGRLLHDHFWNGDLWEIGLARFRESLELAGGELILEATPCREGAPYAKAGAHLSGNPAASGIHSVAAVPVYRIVLIDGEERRC
ncbi:beta-galactosidase [Paenibacillus tarimensis]|uniref:beta-galactosidase n=1 Tax=Paenibacillus tarimensis TaxID=416012 RepID=UPI001F464C73|nr:beta-galactosidase [Paenibacillus tarimensis]MCF2945381.1 beta-galactosidase [Paenibacillus tarimensis]